MKCLVILTVICAGLLVAASRVGFPELKPTDFEVGTWSAEDKLLTIDEKIWFETPGVTLIHENITRQSPYFKFNYVTARELGNNTEATSVLLEGGVGFNFFKVQLKPGEPQNYKYYVMGYGHWLGDAPRMDTVIAFDVKSTAEVN